MTIPSDNSDRQAEALAFLRGALSRCDQEGCNNKDVIAVIRSWWDCHKSLVQSTKKTTRYIRLTDKSPLPEIGAKVRIEDNAEIVSNHNHGDIDIVEGHSINNHGIYLGESYGYYSLRELSLVVEE